MKKVFLPVGAFLLFIVILPLGSCRKSDLPCDPRNGNAEFTQCVIREINNYPAGIGVAQRQTFTYNSKRDPVTGDPGDGNVGTGNPLWVFYYDNKGRLVTFAGVYNNDYFEFWHNYKYDSKDRIISDSLYVFGLKANPGAAHDWRHFQLTYDNLNRIVKEVRTSWDQAEWPDITTTYVYNSAGNLHGDVFSYDDKVNPLLTNKIWRFLARDYSVNNQTQAGAYNAEGLPTLFLPHGYYYSTFLWQIYGDPVNIIYDCGDDHHQGHY